MHKKFTVKSMLCHTSRRVVQLMFMYHVLDYFSYDGFNLVLFCSLQLPDIQIQFMLPVRDQVPRCVEGYTIKAPISIFYDLHAMTKSPMDAFLKTQPHHSVTHEGTYLWPLAALQSRLPRFSHSLTVQLAASYLGSLYSISGSPCFSCCSEFPFKISSCFSSLEC